MFEVFHPGLSVHSHDGPISVFGKLNRSAKIILKNNNDHQILLTDESALGRITKVTPGTYPCALLTLNKEEKCLDLNCLMGDGWMAATPLYCFREQNVYKHKSDFVKIVFDSYIAL